MNHGAGIKSQSGRILCAIKVTCIGHDLDFLVAEGGLLFSTISNVIYFPGLQ
jgi:hypothetical protein